ncbi:MAG TPA: hypothetical protein VLM40_13460, partial [Gemmata sp.]|nr:hypothetical protein [Gemmata sp.]
HQMFHDRERLFAMAAPCLAFAGAIANLPHVVVAEALLPAVPELASDAALGFRTRLVPMAVIEPYLNAGKKIVLTDQFAPVDNLMADVYRYRYNPGQGDLIGSGD